MLPFWIIFGEILVSSFSTSTIGLSSDVTEATSKKIINILKYIKVKSKEDSLIWFSGIVSEKVVLVTICKGPYRVPGCKQMQQWRW